MRRRCDKAQDGSGPEAVARQNGTIQEDLAMDQSPRPYQKCFSARHSEALGIVDTYRHLSPAVFAYRECLAENLAHRAGVGDGATRPIRRWLGGRLVWLGTRLGGAVGPREVMPPAAPHGVTVGG
jgi:hypothetical protein